MHFCFAGIYLSRLRSPLLSGAVLPDPDLELAEAAEETSISKRWEHMKLKEECVDGKEHNIMHVQPKKN